MVHALHDWAMRDQRRLLLLAHLPGRGVRSQHVRDDSRTAGEDVQRNAQRVPEHHRTFGRPEACSITFSKPARLHVHEFSVAPGTADHYPGRFHHPVASAREADLMTVDTTVADVHGRYRRVYAGNTGPDGELVTAISWSSDGSVISNGFKICAARKWTETALNTTRYVADQPLGRLRAMHEDTHEFWCDARPQPARAMAHSTRMGFATLPCASLSTTRPGGRPSMAGSCTTSPRALHRCTNNAVRPHPT